MKAFSLDPYFLLPPSYHWFDKRTNSVTHPLSQQGDTLPSGNVRDIKTRSFQDEAVQSKPLD
jgi:hypothetical protein